MEFDGDRLVSAHRHVTPAFTLYSTSRYVPKKSQRTNLNDHSLFNDTEVNVVTRDAPLARAARIRLWSEHLEMPQEQLQGDPAELIDSVCCRHS